MVAVERLWVGVLEAASLLLLLMFQQRRTKKKKEKEKENPFFPRFYFNSFVKKYILIPNLGEKTGIIISITL